MAAVDKIKEKRKPEDFVGHRNSKTDISIRRGFSAEKRVQQGEPKRTPPDWVVFFLLSFIGAPWQYTKERMQSKP